MAIFFLAVFILTVYWNRVLEDPAIRADRELDELRLNVRGLRVALVDQTRFHDGECGVGT